MHVSFSIVQVAEERRQNRLSFEAEEAQPVIYTVKEKEKEVI